MRAGISIKFVSYKIKLIKSNSLIQYNFQQQITKNYRKYDFHISLCARFLIALK